MLTSTLTSKGQATIPSEIRKNLDLHAGDKVVFEIIDHQVIIRKITPFDHVYHAGLAATLSEWGSAEDDEAYRDL
ncbi:MAG: AbrB/MazE/SpoVT family DNA-binding domain-containing protein [Legionellaceae bacterium]|nr:AbrB/MazE/SpoVT family DNA-binding domain-containing protein [Legionellaceae bacterium]MBP9775815.1 AbrB/MazE/SpoVT family DNA-binding domain-containing protein [Legionellaceae bacterium]